MIVLLLSILLLIIAGYVVINLLYKKTNAYKNEQIPYSKFSSPIPEKLKFAVLGSTYALYAYDGLQDMHLNAFNFALPSESLEIDNVLLHRYADRIAADSVVIICLAACVTFYRYDMVSDRTHYYTFLNRNEIPMFSIKDKLQCLFPLHGKRIKRVLRILKDEPVRNGIYGNLHSSVSKEDAEKNMKGMAEGWISLFHLENLKQADKHEMNLCNQNRNTSLLRSMFQFCYERSWHPIVVIPPFSSELNQYFGDDFIDCSLFKMIGEAIDGMDVPVLDYRTNKSFQQQDSLFIDGGFRLSKYGSTKFIRMILNDLSSLGYNLTNGTIGKSHGCNI